MPKPIHDLMQKEMSRKEFLATLGFGIASILGFSTILRLLGKDHSLLHQQNIGYGSGAYGGTKHS